MAGHASLTVLPEREETTTDEYKDQCVRYTLYSLPFAQRIATNHFFLTEHLPVSCDSTISVL